MNENDEITVGLPQDHVHKKSASRILMGFVALFFSAIFFIFGFSVGRDHPIENVPFDYAKVHNK